MALVDLTLSLKEQVPMNYVKRAIYSIRKSRNDDLLTATKIAYQKIKKSFFAQELIANVGFHAEYRYVQKKWQQQERKQW